MEIDNLEIIKPLLEFPHKNAFFFIQLLSRKKDHPKGHIGGSSNNSRLIKAYFIDSTEKLEKQYPEMIKLAEIMEARVMINLNPRNFQKAAFHLLQKVANQMANGDYYNIYKAYTSVCGEYHAEIDKRFIIDLDGEDVEKEAEITQFVESLQKMITNKPYKILAKIPTRNGLHIITNPFNIDTFAKSYPKIDIHRNNPTLLFFPDSIKPIKIT